MPITGQGITPRTVGLSLVKEMGGIISPLMKYCTFYFSFPEDSMLSLRGPMWSFKLASFSELLNKTKSLFSFIPLLFFSACFLNSLCSPNILGCLTHLPCVWPSCQLKWHEFFLLSSALQRLLQLANPEVFLLNANKIVFYFFFWVRSWIIFLRRLRKPPQEGTLMSSVPSGK